VINAFEVFRKKKAELVSEWGREVPWADLVLAARKTVPRLG